MVTGNGFGFAVVAPETGSATKFYSHPYSCVRPDPANPLSEGVETANFIKELGWDDGTAHGASAEYEEDSHVIHVRRNDGEGYRLHAVRICAPGAGDQLGAGARKWRWLES